MKSTITIIGHKNQDTDATFACMALNNLFNKTGSLKTQVKISDKPNKETEFVFNKLKIKKPSRLNPEKVKSVFLVDFNEAGQSPVNLNKVEIEGLVDHHKLDIKIQKDYPIIFRVEPLGSSSSIVYKMYKDEGIKIDKKTAGMLLAGIISDTLKFNSPTTTKQDREIAKELSQISGLDIAELAKEMFKAKSDLTGISAKEIITTDYKEFDFSTNKTGIGVFETVDPSKALDMEKEIKKALKEYKQKQKLDLVFFAIVDIIKNNSQMILVGQAEENAAKKVFNRPVQDQKMFLEGIVSRKKQIVPEFMKKLK